MSKRLKFKSAIPRQTYWSRKHRAASKQLTLLENVVVNEPVNQDGAILMGNPENWEISSISSEDESSQEFGFTNHTFLSENENTGLSDISETFIMDTTKEFNEPEISSEKIYDGCALTLSESIGLVFAKCTQHNWTVESLETVLLLIKIHMPKSVNFPTTRKQAEKFLPSKRHWLKNIYYCKECYNILENLSCTKCQKDYENGETLRNNQLILQLDVRKQLELLLSSKTVCLSLEKGLQKRSQNGILGGKLVKAPIRALDITLCMNTDGVPLFRSSGNSLWPVLFVINELPLYLKKQCALLGAIWVGKKKIDPFLVFPKLIEDLNSLQTIPLFWADSTGDRVAAYVFVVNCCVDSVARCILQGHTQFNGKYGCTFCEQEGKIVKKGNGFTRIYTHQHQNRRNHELYTSKVMQSEFSLGIKTASPLLLLHNFDIVDGFRVDYMHCVLLGIVRTFLFIWLRSPGLPYYLGSTSALISERYAFIKVPDEVSRIPRSLSETKYWKASEYKTWLFVLPVILDGILDARFLNHFSLLCNFVHKVLRPLDLAMDLVSLEAQVTEFITKVETLYGVEYCVYNVHLLSHMIECIKNWGPVYDNSCFIFEDLNGMLKNWVKSPNGIPIQLARKFLLQMELQNIGKQKMEYNSDCAKLCGRKHGKNKYEKFQILGPFIDCCEGSNYHQEIRLLCPKAKTIMKSHRGIIEHHLFKCIDTDKRTNNIVHLPGRVLSKIICFFKVVCSCVSNSRCDCCCNFILLETFKTTQFGGTDFIFKMRSNAQKRVELKRLSDINATKFMKIALDETEYFVQLPNIIEYE